MCKASSNEYWYIETFIFISMLTQEYNFLYRLKKEDQYLKKRDKLNDPKLEKLKCQTSIAKLYY